MMGAEESGTLLFVGALAAGFRMSRSVFRPVLPTTFALRSGRGCRFRSLWLLFALLRRRLSGYRGPKGPRANFLVRCLIDMIEEVSLKKLRRIFTDS